MPAKTSKPTDPCLIDPKRAMPDGRPLLKLGINADPWAAMDAIMACEPEPMGPEWFTVADFADRYKIARRTGHNRLLEMERKGLVEKWVGRREGVSGGHASKWKVKP